MHTSEETESYRNKDIIKFIKQQRALDKNLPTNLNSNILDKLRHNYMDIDMLNEAQKPMTISTSDNQSRCIILYLRLGLLKSIDKDSIDSTYKLQLSKLGYKLLESLQASKNLKKYYKYSNSSDNIFFKGLMSALFFLLIGSVFCQELNLPIYALWCLLGIGFLIVFTVGSFSKSMDIKADKSKENCTLTF